MQIANQGFHAETILVMIFSIYQNLLRGNIDTSWLGTIQNFTLILNM